MAAAGFHSAGGLQGLRLCLLSFHQRYRQSHQRRRGLCSGCKAGRVALAAPLPLCVPACQITVPPSLLRFAGHASICSIHKSCVPWELEGIIH